MLLASFTAGLFGTPGKQTRFAAPPNMQEALKIAISVEQAERLERRVGAFYVAAEEKRHRMSDRPQDSQSETGQCGASGSA